MERSRDQIVLHPSSILRDMSNHEFFEFCQLNRDLHIERNGKGDLIIMPPTGGETGGRNFILTGIFSAWVEEDGTGFGFDSSTGFTLSNGAIRSPDVAWVARSRWKKLTKEERMEFPPLCPDFVVEIRSQSDSLSTLQAKMEEYISCGARLGWLIDPIEKRVYIYQTQARIRCLENPRTVAGDPVLRNFVLPLDRIW